MEKRRFGRTGHMSTVAIFGAFAFSEASQAEADAGMELILSAGVNHIDVAPSYGHAEERLGPWMPRVRDQFFLGCKTMERDETGAAKEMQESLRRLQVDHFDLYQIHAITTFEELDSAMASGGALEAILDAREKGYTRYIGITGHGLDSPAIFLEALRRFDFDSILFPINFKLFAIPAYRENALELLKQCRAKDVGTMIIKSIAKGRWGEREHTHNTWYEPFTEQEHIQQAVNFSLSQDVTGLCTAGDLQVLPKMLAACENFSPMDEAQQEALIATANQYELIFPAP